MASNSSDILSLLSSVQAGDIGSGQKFSDLQNTAANKLYTDPSYQLTPDDFTALKAIPYTGQDLSSIASGMRTANQQSIASNDFMGTYGGLLPIAAFAAPAVAGLAGAGGMAGADAALGELGINTALPAGAAGGVAAGTSVGDLAGSYGLQGALGTMANLPIDSIPGYLSETTGLGFNPISSAAQQVASVDPVTGQPALAPPASPAAPATPSAPGASPLGASGGEQGGSSFVDKILQDMKNHPIQSLGLGLSAAGMLATGKQKQPAQLGQLSSLGATGQQTAQQLLDQYRSGQLSGPQQASLDQVSRNAKNQINNYFATIGQSDSTAHAQALAQVDQQAEAMKNEMLNQALTQGLQAIGVSSGPLTTAAQIQLQQDRNLQQAFANFAQALGTFGGKSAQQTANPQPTQQVQTAQQNIPG